jgi:phosphoglucosamine mutase
VITTDVGDRYVLDALRREGGMLGGEQSGHVIMLDGHVTGDGLAAALLLCRCLAGRPLADAVAVMPRYAQALENVRVAERVVATEVLEEVDRLNAELGTDGRILVRPSGTEPVIRVLAEAPGKDEAANLCARVARLVRQHGGVAP